ncbi:D-alanyl-D-alanine carboxypeptidase family protein [Thiohalobacter thiocyanaticus]|uniref:serine-type D-Ala-D-Ala carboxypeptidase n=1 Tax=Thiohalobacter thiocyanaticus TaxID=585455 RepID=A0A426QKS6_9GAMM|nr:D-alanyl-D-alanine carboxypeptidase family protein [Thiohalobacter thiocyanaticus]RRQ22363.1 D-alanyl-D-alanine carboxypeptidase [Thiohalobacter thiocyanaticus]
MIKPVLQLAHRFLTVFLLLAFQATAAAPMPVPKAPDVGARSYLLIDYHSGQVLAEKDSHSPVEPASITKMMAVYVVFKELQKEALSLDDQVTVSERAWRMPGSRMFIEVGTRVSVEELLKGVIIQSGNDATVALAEHIAGSEATFAEYMNKYAADLGLENSHFMNSTGLPDPEHYMSAADIARVARALIREFPEYYEWYSQKSYTYNEITQNNRNKLLWRDASVDGIKTGHTEAAGYCLVTSAQREGMRLISVVLGTSSEEARAEASQSLLNYAFRFFETHKLYDAGAKLVDARIWKGASESLPLGVEQDLYLTIPRGRYDELQANVQRAPRIIAPVAAGESQGSLVINLDGATLTEVPLVALQSVDEGSFWQRTVDEVLLYFE